jgi:hypothetical protein
MSGELINALYFAVSLISSGVTQALTKEENASCSFGSFGRTLANVFKPDAPHAIPVLENLSSSPRVKLDSKESVRNLPMWLVVPAKNAIPRGTFATVPTVPVLMSRTVTVTFGTNMIEKNRSSIRM